MYTNIHLAKFEFGIFFFQRKIGQKYIINVIDFSKTQIGYIWCNVLCYVRIIKCNYIQIRLQ